MRKLILVILLIIFAVATFFFYVASEKDRKPTREEDFENLVSNITIETENIVDLDNISIENIIENKVDEVAVNTNKKVILEVNGNSFEVTLENNTASNELYEKIKNEGLTLRVRDYGGFEKVGALGFPLTREDKEIETFPGDLVLYNGSQISIFYKPHSWSYTKLGHFDAENVEELLGKGEVEVTFKVVENEVTSEIENVIENKI